MHPYPPPTRGPGRESNECLRRINARLTALPRRLCLLSDGVLDESRLADEEVLRGGGRRERGSTHLAWLPNVFSLSVCCPYFLLIFPFSYHFLLLASCTFLPLFMLFFLFLPFYLLPFPCLISSFSSVISPIISCISIFVQSFPLFLASHFPLSFPVSHPFPLTIFI